jgi:HEAT repeat protein
MLAELKDPRAISVLVPLLRDEEVNYKVAWALGEIADRRAIKPLMESLTDKNSDVRVLAIQALEKLGAEEALPKLRALLGDKEKAHFGDQLSVSEAAKTAIAKLEKKP